MSGMEPHSEEAHLMERMRRVTAGDKIFIEDVAVVEDRQALTSAYTFTRYYRKIDAEAPENICNDDLTLWKQWRNKALKSQFDRAREVK